MWVYRLKNGTVSKRSTDVGTITPDVRSMSHRSQQVIVLKQLYAEAERRDKTVSALIEWKFLKPGRFTVSPDGDWEQEDTEPLEAGEEQSGGWAQF